MLQNFVAELAKPYSIVFLLLKTKWAYARILFTDVLLDFRATVGGTGQDYEEMQKYFGNLSSSAVTLFRAISDGISWQIAADALLPAGQFWVQLFHFYIAFCSFALLNVMTGAGGMHFFFSGM